MSRARSPPKLMADAPDRRATPELSLCRQPDAARSAFRPTRAFGSSSARHIKTLMRRMGVEALYRQPQHLEKQAPGHRILSLPAARPGHHAARPGLGHGHHLHSDGARIRLSGRGGGLVQPQSSCLEAVQPISPIGPIYPRDPIPGIAHTQSLPTGATERPLPPLPSRFRLGEDGLPWSTEPWYQPQSPGFAAPTVVGIQNEDRRGEDPQRVRELGALHAAMMTVDSMPHEGWEPWTWDSVGDMPRGPRSLGWAVSRDDSVLSPVSQASAPSAPSVASPPPPYVVSQWEQSFSRSNSMRPMSSG